MIPTENTLYDGDCIEVLRQWDAGCIDHCITDPPKSLKAKTGLTAPAAHGEDRERQPRAEYLAFCRAWLSEVCRVVKPNGNIFLIGTYENIYDLGYLANEMGLMILNSVVWFKPYAQISLAYRTMVESTEHILWVCNAPKEKAHDWFFNERVARQLVGGKPMRNLWTFPYPAAERQPATSSDPRALDALCRIVLVATRPNDLVLDCFAGNGATGVVAQSFGRRWALIEKDTTASRLARERIATEKAVMPAEPEATPARRQTPAPRPRAEEDQPPAGGYYRPPSPRPPAERNGYSSPPDRRPPPRFNRPSPPQQQPVIQPTRSIHPEDDRAIARRAIEDIEAWLRDHEHTLSLQNVSADPDYRCQDIVLLWQTRKQLYKVGVKGDRWHSRGNFTFETESNREKGTPGCFFDTEADLWFYYFVSPRILYILPVDETRRWLQANMERFEERLSTSSARGQNGIERITSSGRMIPIETLLAEVPGVRVEKLGES